MKITINITKRKIAAIACGVMLFGATMTSFAAGSFSLLKDSENYGVINYDNNGDGFKDSSINVGEVKKAINYLSESRVKVLDGFTTTQSTYTINNPAFKDCTYVQVVYADEDYDITPSYNVDNVSGRLTISGLSNTVVAKCIIVYHE